MLMTEIFRTERSNTKDNATCDVCRADFTIPDELINSNSAIACPNCGSSQNSKESIRNKNGESNYHHIPRVPDGGRESMQLRGR